MLPINTLTCTVLTPPSEEIVLVGSLAGSGDPAATPYPTIAHLHNPIMNQPTSRITNGGEPYTDRHRSTESATHSSQIFPYSAYWGSRLESRIGRKAQSNLDCRGLFRRRTVPSVLWKGCFKCHWRSREWWWFCFVATGVLSLVQKTAEMNAHDIYTELGLTRRSYVGKKAIPPLRATWKVERRRW